jgi:hypothetical protein
MAGAKRNDLPATTHGKLLEALVPSAGGLTGQLDTSALRLPDISRVIC